MTRKDFETIAGIIRSISDTTERKGTALLFAAYLAGTNPRFDKNKFIAACGVN
jgi:hypothetical protein